MGQFHRGNHINIPGFAVVDLGLSGNELICFSLVYGFAQDGESQFYGSLGYIASALNVTRVNAKAILTRLINKGLIIKFDRIENNVKLCRYSISKTVIEIAGGCYRNSNTPGTETVPNNIIDINKDNIDNNIINDGSKMEPQKQTRKKAETVENLCLFADSKFNDFNKFLEQFKGPDFERLDMWYYYSVVSDWSASNGAKKRDWIATTRNWIRSDKERRKLHLNQQVGVALDPSAVKYLQEMGEGLF